MRKQETKERFRMLQEAMRDRAAFNFGKAMREAIPLLMHPDGSFALLMHHAEPMEECYVGLTDAPTKSIEVDYLSAKHA